MQHLSPGFGDNGILRRAAWLVPFGLASYGPRSASSRLALAWAGDKRFDPRVFGVLGAGTLLALALLPLPDGWPVLVSAPLWFAVMAIGRALAVADAIPAGPRAEA